HYADEGFDLVLTTGGTGLTPDDVTPEATLAAIDRELPGIAEALRAESLKHTPMGMLSRGVAGLVGRTLVVNLPGSTKALDQLFPVLAPVLRHAVGTAHRQDGQRHDAV
ncbi:MAG: molybdenum cofactor biosynthesis protein B, partial [Baekduiaceae bacterium]